MIFICVRLFFQNLFRSIWHNNLIPNPQKYHDRNKAGAQWCCYLCFDYFFDVCSESFIRHSNLHTDLGNKSLNEAVANWQYLRTFQLLSNETVWKHLTHQFTNKSERRLLLKRGLRQASGDILIFLTFFDVCSDTHNTKIYRQICSTIIVVMKPALIFIFRFDYFSKLCLNIFETPIYIRNRTNIIVKIWPTLMVIFIFVSNIFSTSVQMHLT